MQIRAVGSERVDDSGYVESVLRTLECPSQTLNDSHQAVAVKVINAKARMGLVLCATFHRTLVFGLSLVFGLPGKSAARILLWFQ